MKDQGLKYIGKGLQRLISLQSLNLNFHGCGPITDEGISSISEGLGGLISLQSINLDLGW